MFSNKSIFKVIQMKSLVFDEETKERLKKKFTGKRFKNAS